MSEQNGKIDLRTAQSTVHSFLVQAIDEARRNGEVARLTKGTSARADLAAQTEALLLELLALPGGSDDGISQVRDRIRQRCLAELAPEGSLGQLGFSLVADAQAQSPTSFVVRVPEAIPGATLVKRLEQEAGISISPALHPLANTKNHNVVRFGVYSANTEDEVETMLHELHGLAGTMLG